MFHSWSLVRKLSDVFAIGFWMAQAWTSLGGPNILDTDGYKGFLILHGTHWAATSVWKFKEMVCITADGLLASE